MEDDGTPPASSGLLSSSGEREVFGVPELGAYGLEQRRAIRKAPGAGVRRVARKWRKLLLPDSERESGVDLVRLLDENWFWRSHTASPSMADLTPARGYGQTPSSRPPSSSPFQERAERSWSGAASTSGRSSGEAQEGGHAPLSRRSRSEGIDGLSAALEERDVRAHSYAQGTAIQRRGSSSQPPEPDPTEGDPLGTWAHRVFRFMPERQPTAPTHIPGTPDLPAHPPRPQQQPLRCSAVAEGEEGGEEDEEDAASEERAVEAAWRWRFNRRWRTEQAKQFDPDFGLTGDDDDDGWDTALGYLDACGPGFHLQVARTTSIENGLAAAGSLRSSVSDIGGVLLDESAPDKAPLQETADGAATKSIVSVAKKARDLYRQQQRIERDVQTRWGDAKVSMSWAGQHLPAVRVDAYGAFPFVLLKVSDRTAAHRLLVRGRNGATPAELVAAAAAEVKQVCAEKQLAGVSLGLLGSGTMEWSRERDHRVNVCSGRVEKGGDPSIQTADDIVRLAGALTRASLPAPNRVTVNGEKLS